MKNLKKLIAVLLLVAVGLTMTACSAPSECEGCGAAGEKLKKVTYEGESAWLCSECQMWIELAEALGGLY